MDGGYSARNGARDAPQHRSASSGNTIGDDFPQVCETCLGPNPYVRMSKLPFGQKLCKISSLPYQAFRWKAGPSGRHKETIISYAVAAERNICQTCLNDMIYGLPVGVRDKLLQQQEQQQQLGNQIALPHSAVGQQYFYEQQMQQVLSGQLMSAEQITNDPSNAVPARQLDHFARALLHRGSNNSNSSRTAFRNLPKLCSFWLTGSCTRVLRGSCPFRPCCGPTAFAFPEIAGNNYSNNNSSNSNNNSNSNSKNDNSNNNSNSNDSNNNNSSGSKSNRELCDALVQQLHQHGAAVVMRQLDAATRAALQQATRGCNRDDAIRSRVHGDDQLTHKYLARMKDMHLELSPPADNSIITLWIGNLDASISEADLRAAIYAHGQINSITLLRNASCAFVEYVDRDAAEQAAKHLYKALTINGRPLHVNWAKPRVEAAAAAIAAAAASGAAIALPPPPGMERAPAAAYQLPGLPPPQLNTPQPPPPQQQQLVGSTRGASVISNSNNSGNSGGGAAKRQKTAAAASHFSSYGDDSDDDTAATTTAAVPTAVAAVPVVAVKRHYPSMNPARMGAKI